MRPHRTQWGLECYSEEGIVFSIQYSVYSTAPLRSRLCCSPLNPLQSRDRNGAVY